MFLYPGKTKPDGRAVVNSIANPQADYFAGRFSTVQLITNHDELHVYAAGKVVEGLRRGASGDALLGAAAYLLGAH